MLRPARMATLFAGLALAVAYVLQPAIPGHADGGTLTTTNTKITYTHGPFVVANVTDQVGPPNCSAPQMCDDFALVVNVPTGSNTKYDIHIKYTWDQSLDSLTDFDLWVLNSSGQVIASNVSGVSPAVVSIPAVSGNYTVRADPWFPGGESYTGTITLDPKAATGTLPPDAATQSTAIAPRYENNPAPAAVGGTGSGEPSLGVDWKTGSVMYVAGLQTLKAKFDTTTSPAQSTWTDVSAVNTSVTSLDPILYTDSTTGRTFVSQLTGQDSLTAYSDDDGANWTPSQGGGIPSGADHQTIGAGPYSTNAPLPGPGTTLGFNHAVYYCSQDIATAFCARSDDGGLTFGAGVPLYNLTQCSGIHGHVKVAPDGTVYVPNRSCGGKQGVAVSTDNGATWAVRTVPDSTAAIGNDPSLGIGSDGTVYFGYQGADGHARIAISHDRGVTWTKSVDVGALAGIQNMVFPAVVAGDGARATFAYLGTTTGGNFQSQPLFNGVWYLFTSTTYDGGKTWSTVNATPNDPVQRGSICISGTTCSNTPDDRNLLDFIDAQIDSTGRVYIAYADGCIGACVPGTGATDPNSTKQSTQSQLNSFTALATIVRQSGGHTLFAKYDTTQPSAPARPRLTATEPSASGPVTLSWQAPDNGGSPITSYKLYRGTSSGHELYLTNVGTHLSYVDKTVRAGTTYYYKLVASNKLGSSLPSPEVTPTIVSGVVSAGASLPKPACTTVSDTTGDARPAGSTSNVDALDIVDAGFLNTNSTAVTAQLQVKSLNDGPGGLPAVAGDGDVWYVTWSYNGTSYFVGAQFPDAAADPSSPLIAISFVYGHVSTSPTGGAFYNTDGNGTGSVDLAKGIITLSAPRSGVGNPATGASLVKTGATTFESVGAPGVGGLLETADTAGPGDSYTLGNSC